MTVAVFCSSRPDVSPMFLAEAERLGEKLARSGNKVVYGGANCGCMGALARGVLDQGGQLIGVIPEFDFMDGVVQEGLSEKYIVPNLADRKQAMIQLADAFLVFPGGLGTLDEALEVMTLKATGALKQPILFYNFLDVWTPFLESLDLLVEQRLIRQPIRELVIVLDKLEQLRENLPNAL